MRAFQGYFAGIRKDRYVLKSLAGQDILSRYRGSFLGMAWSILTPLLLSIIIGGVYSVIFGVAAKEFIPKLFSGLNPWNFINACATGGTFAYFSAEGYLKQTQVSPQIFPLRTVCVAFVDYLFSMLAFFVVYYVLAPDKLRPGMLFVIPASVILFFFGAAFANITAGITLYIRDFRPFLGLVMQGLFYVTPIIYTTDMLDEAGYSSLYRLNPFYYLIDIVRTPALGNGMPDGKNMAYTCILTLAVSICGVLMCMRNAQGIALKL